MESIQIHKMAKPLYLDMYQYPIIAAESEYRSLPLILLSFYDFQMLSFLRSLSNNELLCLLCWDLIKVF